MHLLMHCATAKTRKGKWSMIVRDAVVEYLAAIPADRRPNTKRVYRQRLLVFADWCQAENVTLEQLGGKRSYYITNAFMDYLRNMHHGSKKDPRRGFLPISSRTVEGYICCIKMFLNWCIRQEDEEFSLCIKPIALGRIKLPKPDQKIVETFTEAQIKALFKACESEYNPHMKLRNKTIVQLFLGTGIRVEELCTMTVGHMDLLPDDPFIKVMGKGRKEREISLDEETRRVLASYKRKFRGEASGYDPFFVDRSLSHELTTSGVQQMIEKLGHVAHITGVRCSPHTFRHTFATRFMRAGGDVLKLSRILGHKRVSITEKYLEGFSSRDVRQS